MNRIYTSGIHKNPILLKEFFSWKTIALVTNYSIRSMFPDKLDLGKTFVEIEKDIEDCTKLINIKSNCYIKSGNSNYINEVGSLVIHKKILEDELYCVHNLIDNKEKLT